MEYNSVQRMEVINNHIEILNQMHRRFFSGLHSQNPPHASVPPVLDFSEGKFSMTYQGNVAKFSTRHVRLSDNEFMMEYVCSVRFKDEDILLWKFYLASDGKLFDKPSGSQFDHVSNPSAGHNIRLLTMKFLIESKVFAV